MRRTLRLAGILALTTGAMLVIGGVVFTQVVALSILAVAVVLAAVALSIEQGFRLLEGVAQPMESPVPSERAGAVVTR